MAARRRLWERYADEALALMITRRKQWQRQWEECAAEALALMTARRRLWQRQWQWCANKAFAPMAARWRRWQRQWEGCAGGALALMAARRRQWEGCAVEAHTPMVARQRAARWIRGWSLQTQSPEITKGLLLLESVGCQDKKDRMLQLAWNWCLAHAVPTSMSCTK